MRLIEALIGRRIIAGDRIDELLGEEGLADLPATGRLTAFTTHLIPVPAANVNIGMPNHVERSGTWTGVDGHVGSIQPARQAPAGVWQLDRTLNTLRDLLAAARTTQS